MAVYLEVTWRMISVVALFLAVAVLMGKRHVAELSVFDLVIAVTLGAVAGADLADPVVPHGPTLYAIAGLGLIHILLSRLVLKNRAAGVLITFDPTIVIQDGVILRRNLAKLRYTVDELLSHLRQKDVFDITEVKYAILEPSGALSILKRAAAEQLQVPVVLEGKVDERGLAALGREPEWLSAALQQMGYVDPRQVFLALANADGDLYVSPMDQPERPERLTH